MADDLITGELMAIELSQEFKTALESALRAGDSRYGVDRSTSTGARAHFRQINRANQNRRNKIKKAIMRELAFGRLRWWNRINELIADIANADPRGDDYAARVSVICKMVESSKRWNGLERVAIDKELEQELAMAEVSTAVYA